MDTEIRVSTESWPWRRKFSHRSCTSSQLKKKQKAMPLNVQSVWRSHWMLKMLQGFCVWFFFSFFSTSHPTHVLLVIQTIYMITPWSLRGMCKPYLSFKPFILSLGEVCRGTCKPVINRGTQELNSVAGIFVSLGVVCSGSWKSMMHLQGPSTGMTRPWKVSCLAAQTATVQRK